MNDLIRRYKNGNYTVKIYDDGTKIRESETNFIPIFPESIDIKITNKCDVGCSYCYESCVPKGEHGDLEYLFDQLSELPDGIELAINGNDLDHPQLEWFLHKCKYHGFIVNITVNSKILTDINIGKLLDFQGGFIYDIYEKSSDADKLIYGVGISHASSIGDIKKCKNIKNTVIHFIAGINNPNDIYILQSMGFSKFLILGYKDMGRGRGLNVSNNMNLWKKQLEKLFMLPIVISFDNLSLLQLSVKKIISYDIWDKYYMGDEFQYSLYIDSVNKQYAPHSRSNKKERVNMIDTTLLNYFNNNKNEQKD